MAKKYRLRDGIVRTTVCGETLLIATRAIREICPNSVHLEPPAVFFLELVLTGMEEKSMIEEVAAHFNVSEECAKKNLNDFIAQLENFGCIVAENCE